MVYNGNGKGRSGGFIHVEVWISRRSILGASYCNALSDLGHCAWMLLEYWGPIPTYDTLKVDGTLVLKMDLFSRPQTIPNFAFGRRETGRMAL